MAPTSSCTDQAEVLETAEPDVQPEAVVQVGKLRFGVDIWLLYGACHCFHIIRDGKLNPIVGFIYPIVGFIYPIKGLSTVTEIRC